MSGAVAGVAPRRKCHCQRLQAGSSTLPPSASVTLTPLGDVRMESIALQTAGGAPRGLQLQEVGAVAAAESLSMSGGAKRPGWCRSPAAAGCNRVGNLISFGNSTPARRHPMRTGLISVRPCSRCQTIRRANGRSARARPHANALSHKPLQLWQKNTHTHSSDAYFHF